jgi:hypothetical protein
VNGRDDEYDEMIDRPGVRGEAGGRAVLGDEDVTRFLMELRSLGDVPPPKPSPELAALLGGATPILGRRTVVRIVVRTAAVAALVLGVLVLAAANHSLPASAQRVVSNVVNVLTPFHIAAPVTSPAPLPPPPSDKPHPSSSPVPPPHHSTPPASPWTTVGVKGDDGGVGNGDDRTSGGRAGTGDDGTRGGGSGDDRSERSSPRSRSDDSGSGERERGGGSGDDRARSSTPRPSPSRSESGDDGGEPGDH